jgi:tetratricopeptide (TPR) repeat protein
MKQKITLLLMALLLATTGVFLLAEEKDGFESYFQEMSNKFRAAEDAQERLSLCQEFLKKYPDTNYTPSIVAAAKAQFAAMDRPAEFVPMIKGLLDRIEDPERQQRIRLVLAEAYGDAGATKELAALAGKIVSGDQVTFNTYLPLIRSMVEARMWKGVLKYAGKAETFANAEAYAKEFPDRNYSQEQLQESARNRQGMLLTYAGWAKANTGQADEALADFQKAEPLVNKHYLGYSADELDLYWGKTLLQQGQAAAALERLASKAIFGNDESALDAYKAAYVKKNGSEDGFAAFMDKQRPAIARTLDNLAFETYDNQKIELGDFKGKVVLLAFWFPT